MFFLGCLVGSQLHAQDAIVRYKIGESVKAYHLGEWRDGMVANQNKAGQVLVEVEFAGSKSQRTFANAQVIHVYEVGAIARARYWTDTTGKFRVKAALLEVKENDVRLRSEKEEELSIEIVKLCEADQRYLKNFAVKTAKQQAAAEASGAIPMGPITEFDTLGAIEVGLGNIQGIKIGADPQPIAVSMSEKGVMLPPLDRGDHVTTVIPLGGPKNWILVATRNLSSGPAKLFWVNLVEGKVVKTHLLPDMLVMDYHPSSQRLLTYQDGARWTDKSTTTVWDIGPTKESPKQLVSWDAYAGGSGWNHHDNWLRFAGKDLVVNRNSEGSINAWDIEKRRMVWTTPQQSFFQPVPCMSPGGRYVFVPEDKGVRVIESSSGNLVGSIALTTSVSGVAVNNEGTELAVLNWNELIVCNLESGSTRVIKAPNVAGPTEKLNWVSDQWLAIDEGRSDFSLFSLAERLRVWRYDASLEVVNEWGRDGGRPRSFFNQHLVYAASANGRRNSSNVVVGAVKLPGANIQPKIDAIKREQLLIVKKGSRVRLEVEPMSGIGDVESIFKKKVQDHGWVIDSSSSTVVHASMSNGETQTIQYKSQSFGRKQADEQSITVTPIIYKLYITVGDKVIWNSSTSSGAPPVVFLEKGQTLAEEARKWQIPNNEFFKRVSLPDEVIDMNNAALKGVATVSTRGIELVTPP